MRQKFVYLCLGLLWCASCAEPPAEDSTKNQLDVIEQAPIPTRPEEVEVFDLTEEVPLFLVIAGAYSSEEGAGKKVASLINMGFENADVIQRADSKLFSVFVERFDSEALAEAFVKQIATDHQIKSYVYEMDQ